MVSKIGDRKITITPKVLKDNERHCDKCGGTGWIYIENDNEKYIERCPVCDNGVIHICPKCGKELGRITYCTSNQCRLQRDRKEELRLYKNAKKYTLDNVPKESCEYFYHESFGYDNGYFYDIDSLEDYCKENDIDMPKYIWGTYKKTLHIEAYDIIENVLEEWYEDAISMVDDKAMSKLQDSLDEFCVNCGLSDCYEVDYDVCIELQ